jgi:hypothetical protein
MRRGAAPRQAALEVLVRIIESCELLPEHQVAILALNREGHWSAAALRTGYSTAIRTPAGSDRKEPDVVLM